MDKRDIDEQLNDLRFDMDDEIDARNERRGWQPQPARHAYRPMETSHAIILAAIIIVGGLWGGKLVYDYIQEQRLKAELTELARFMDNAIKDLDNNNRQMQSDIQKRSASVEKAAQQHKVNEDRRRLDEIARAQQEKKSQSAQCQFWRQQHALNPDNRNTSKKEETCN
ncbi:hypothetical protein [Pseudomonas sp. OHS18]|uniref:hypothetical protein n=1 Tax=Pseudomonas sp. OHS18 TaxID=3399679 RepID=UPI003A899693